MRAVSKIFGVLLLIVLAWRILAFLFTTIAGIIILALTGLACLILMLCSVYTGNRKVSSAEHGDKFLHLCADRLTKTGSYIGVMVTSPSEEHGPVILAQDQHGEIWVFRCEHIRSRYGRLSVDTIREAGVLRSLYGAARAAVITDGELTDWAKKVAYRTDISVYRYEPVQSEHPTDRRPKRAGNVPSTDDLIFFEEIIDR